MTEPLTIKVAEAARMLGISESAAYEAAARGDIPSVRIGRRVLIKRLELLAMFDPAAATLRATGSTPRS